MVQTETAERDYGGDRVPVIAEQAIQRYQQPEDLVGLLVFLASRESAFITGQTILAGRRTDIPLMGIRVRMEPGGTFTHLVAVDDETGTWSLPAKVPSNAGGPGGGDLQAALLAWPPVSNHGQGLVHRRRHDARNQRGAHPLEAHGSSP